MFQASNDLTQLGGAGRALHMRLLGFANGACIIPVDPVVVVSHCGCTAAALPQEPMKLKHLMVRLKHPLGQHLEETVDRDHGGLMSRQDVLCPAALGTDGPLQMFAPWQEAPALVVLAP